MFSTLLETKRKKQRNFGSTLMSATMHVMLVMGAVYASAKAGEPEAAAEENETYTEIRPDPEPPKPKPPEDPLPTEAPLVRKGFTSLVAPVVIPDVIPEINSSLPETNVDDFNPKGPRGDPRGFIPSASARGDSTYFIFEVEKVARFRDGPEPNYPSILKQTKQTGKVLVQFVIDTSGKADMSTFKIVESTNQLFADEVKRALPKYRFEAAQISDRKVRMMVQLPFEFKLDPKGGGD